MSAMFASKAARVLFGTMVVSALVARGTRATTISLAVDEPSGIARTADPVTSGVPIAPADTLATSWALFDGATEIPVQTRVLFGVRTPWLLLDFQSSLNPGAKKIYTLVSQRPTVSASPALNIDDSSSGSITVITGPLKVQIGKSPFNLFNGVWLDRNHDGTFSSSEKLVTSTSSDNLPLLLAGDITRAGRRAPLRWSWEDRGPLRATLRVDGYYGDPNVVKDTLLYYTDRITFHAGQTYVTVDHLIRNSFHASERYVKVKSARLLVPGGSPASARARRSGDRVWIQAGASGAAFEMIPDSLTYTSWFSDPVRIEKTMGVSANGGMTLPDWSYYGTHVRFEFSDAKLNKPEQSRRATGYIDRLAALAPAGWYSDRGAFGAEQFGTWDDEKNANQQWGWRWPNTTHSPIRNLRLNCLADEPALPRPDWSYYPSWSTLSADNGSEEDLLWAHLLMYARTGQRTYLDRADRWARYSSWEYAYRTDGFGFQDRTHCDTLVRARNNLPAGAPFTPADTAFIRFNTQDEASRGRLEAGHSWNGGLVDYYYLTGDRDALAAALDIAEQTMRYSGCADIDSLWGGAALRLYTRSYLNLLRAWEATGAPVWRLGANRLKAMMFHTPRYDPRGFYYFINRGHYSGGKYVCPYQEGEVSRVLYRDWVLTGQRSTGDSLAVRLRALADFAYRYGADARTGFTGEDMVIDYPRPGNVLHLTMAMYRDSVPPLDSNPSSSNSFVDALAIGRRVGGPAAWMSKARSLWEHASKYAQVDGSVYRIADDRHVGRFLFSLQCGDGVGPIDSEITTMNLYFHDAARAPFDVEELAAVTDLAVVADHHEAALQWTAPGEPGGTVRAAGYDVRYATAAITPVNFVAAKQVAINEAGDPGDPQCIVVKGLKPCTNYWFAIRALDENGNWSAMSSVATAATDCKGGRAIDGCGGLLSTARIATEESDMPRTVEFALAGPNPVMGPSAVAFGIPASMAGQRLDVSLFDLAGRRVRTLESGTARAGRFRVAWNEGSAMPSGAYFLVMRIGPEARVQRLVLVR
jgi:hypothetical protein